MDSLIRLLSDVRDFVQYAIGDREPVIRRFRERSQRAWEEVYRTQLGSKMKPVKTRLNGRGQVTLPKDMRDRLGIHAGDYLDVSLKKDSIVLSPHVVGLDEICSALPLPERPLSVEQMDRAIEEAAQE